MRKHEHKTKGGTVSVKWRAEITVNGKKTSLGYHDTEEKAARAYDAAVRGHPGFNITWLNFRSDNALPVRSSHPIVQSHSCIHSLDFKHRRLTEGYA